MGLKLDTISRYSVFNNLEKYILFAAFLRLASTFFIVLAAFFLISALLSANAFSSLILYIFIAFFLSYLYSRCETRTHEGPKAETL